MRTKESLMKEFESYRELVVSRREQFDKFIEILNERSNYFDSPASPRYHCNWEHGLLEHSLNVVRNALRIKQVLAPGIPDESCVICGLFHDLGKAPIDGKYYKKVEPSPKQVQYGYVPYPAFKYDDDPNTFMTVPQKSVRQVTQYIPLHDYEYQAILIHDGQYVDENHSYKCKENPFALILHYADSFSGFVIEGTRKQSLDGKSYVLEESIVGIIGGFDSDWIRREDD